MPTNGSLADVARLAGVSQQTVSRVANNPHGSGLVSKKTRERVEAAMQKVGYRPNYAAQALRRGTFETLGLAMFDITATGNIGLLGGVAEAARTHGYAITVQILDNTDRTLAAVERRMARLPVDGIIVVMEKMLDDLATFRPVLTAPITVMTSAAVQACSTIDADQAQGARCAVDRFHSFGHERIAFIPGPQNSVSSTIREDSYCQRMRQLGLSPLVLDHGDWTADSGYKIGERLASLVQRGEVTAVLAANDNMANGVWQAFVDAGLRIPQDVSLIGIDNSLKETIANLPLDSLDQHFTEIGRQAVNLTLRTAKEQKKTGHLPTPEHHLIHMEMVKRHSVGPVPQR